MSDTGKEMNDELIIRYFTREASEDELAALAGWLDESADNRDYFASMENLWNLSHPACRPEEIRTMEALGKVESMIGFLEEPDRRAVRRRRILRIAERAAACLSVPLLAASAYLFFRPGDRASLPEDECSMIEVRTLAGMTGQVSLPDGSRVWLNSGSTLTYPAVFGSGCREVRLDGEGYFKVEKDSTRAFHVHCPRQVISVLGTEFDLDAYSDSPCTVTTLLSGSVALRSESGSECIMVPGQMAQVDDSGSIDIRPGEDFSAGTWRDDRISFSGTCLSDALRLIGNRYGVRFDIRNESLKKHSFRGTVSGQNLEAVLSHLSYISGIRFVRPKEAGGEGREVIEVY